MDSPLSITASIAGILTFLYAILAGVYFVFQTASQTFDEVSQMYLSLTELHNKVNAFMMIMETSAKQAEDNWTKKLARTVCYAVKESMLRMTVVMKLITQMLYSKPRKAREHHHGIVREMLSISTRSFGLRLFVDETKHSILFALRVDIHMQLDFMVYNIPWLIFRVQSNGCRARMNHSLGKLPSR